MREPWRCRSDAVPPRWSHSLNASARLSLYAELFEVQVSLDAAQDVVADFVTIPQIDDRVALGLDHGVANGAMLDQFLLGS